MVTNIIPSKIKHNCNYILVRVIWPCLTIVNTIIYLPIPKQPIGTPSVTIFPLDFILSNHEID